MFYDLSVGRNRFSKAESRLFGVAETEGLKKDHSNKNRLEAVTLSVSQLFV